MSEQTARMRVNEAFYAAERRRPYLVTDELLDCITPGGGDWRAVALDGAITRSVMWGDTEVALVNPVGALSDQIEGQIAMGLRAMPVCDKALRTIMMLAENSANLSLIAKIAETAVAFIELPAPEISRPDEPEPESDDEEDPF